MKTKLRTALIVVGLATAAAMGGAASQTLLNHAAFARTEREVASARSALQDAGDLSNVFKVVSKAVEPSVVSISTESNVPVSNNPFRRFFPPGGGAQPQIPGMPDTDEDGNSEGGNGGIAQGTGSGIIMQVDGSDAYVLTNNHVVKNANKLTVTLSDGRIIKDVKVVGVDPRTDLAVVKIRGDKFIPGSWGDSSKMEKGDWVIAFGSPLGYVGSMTHGIISALDRQVGILGPSGFEQFIQTDAAINPGNSGGPLVSTKGEVIGINAAIASQSGGFQGLGFAIPANIARPVFESLKASGHVTRGYLGIEIQDVTAGDERDQQVVKDTGYEGKGGVIIKGVSKDAPAEGKLEPEDIVTAIEGKDIKTMREFREVVAATKPGGDLKMTVFRGGKNVDVTVSVGEQPDAVKARTEQFADRGLNRKGGQIAQGLVLQDVTPARAERFGLEGVSTGALVTQIRPNSPAAQAGINVGDVISKIDGKPVKSAKDALDLLTEKSDKAFRVRIVNKQGSQLLVLPQK